MPIPVAAVITPPGGPTDPQVPATFASPVARWRGGNGDELLLSDCPSGIAWLPGRGGTDMPPYELIEEPLIGGEGSLLVGVRTLPRTVTIPLLVHLDEFGAWRELQQRFWRSIDPTTGPGRLTIGQPDGTSRHLDCTYVGGAEGQDIQDPRGLWYRIYPAQWRGHAPYTYGDRTRTLRWGIASEGGLLTPPFLPLKLANSQVLGETTALNEGHVDTNGVWTVIGPGGPFTARHLTRGHELVLDYELETGDVATIDTRPMRRSARLQDGTNLWPNLGWPPQMWPLAPGANDIELLLEGATTASQVRFSYVPRFLGF